jgi:TrmH family RNA methyltransferase
MITGDILQPGTKNKTVSRFAHLNRSRSFREKQNAFAMEGSRLVLDAAESGVKLSALLLTEKAAAQFGEAILAAAPRTHTLLLSDALAAEIADTENAQGVFAVGEMCEKRAISPQRGQHIMLLHHVQDPANLGAVIRTAEALGTDGLYLYQCCDLYNPKVIRGSMGAIFRAPIRRIKDTEAFFAHCRSAGVPVCAAVVDRDAVLLGQYDFSRGGVVLIGNEGNGLPREVSDRCDVKLTIPMSPASNSLNAAMAAGLFLWEMAKT